MPQAAWEALLAVRGPGPLPPVHRGNPLPVAPDHPPPSMGHRCLEGVATTPPPPHREGKGQREGLRQGADERRKVAGRRPQGQGCGGNATRGQETTKGPGKGRARGRGTEGEGATTGTRAHTQEGHATTEGPAPPHPESTAQPQEAHTSQNTPPQHEPDAARTALAHAHRPTDPAQGREGTPTGGEGATPTEGAA